MIADGSGPTEMRRVARMARAILEPVWIRWHLADAGAVPAIPSRNTCGRSSLFLQRALGSAGIEASLRHGVPREAADAGYFNGTAWQAHSWVEAAGWIVDITADQFGAPPVILLPAVDPSYRIGIDTAPLEPVARRQRLVDEIWPLWLSLGANARTI